MALRFVSVLAALVLLAACETASDRTDTAADTGAAAQDRAPVAATAQPIPGPVAGSVEDFVVSVGDRVFFDFDKYNIRPDAREVLQRQAAWLQRHRQVTITIEGHADERGTREYNLALGERRANSARNYLVALGVDPNRITTISYGKERPAVAGSNEAAWAQNRRAVSVPRVPGT